MQDADFKDKVVERVSDLATEYAISEDKAFVLFFASDVLLIDADTAYEGSMLGGKNDLGLDLGLIDKEGQTVLLVQGKFSDSMTRDIIRGFRAVPAVLDDPAKVRAAEANVPVVGFSREYRKALKKNYRLRSCLAHFGELSKALQAEVGDAEDWGFARIKQEYEKNLAIALPKKPKQVDLQVNGEHQFRFADRPGRPRCVVCELPLRELHRLYREH